MILEEEVKGLIKDIKKMENERDRILDVRDMVFIDATKLKYQKQAEDLERKIIRRMEILRIISKDL